MNEENIVLGDPRGGVFVFEFHSSEGVGLQQHVEIWDPLVQGMDEPACRLRTAFTVERHILPVSS